MTIQESLDVILDLYNIETPEAKKLLEMEMTTHNIEKAKTYVFAHWNK